MRAVLRLRRGRAAPRRQRGQALVVALGVLLAGGAMLVAMFSAGRVAIDKQRLVDTADAAAHGAAVWRARVLNYHAYANRAIVANEVAIAQAVTLLAWSKYFESLATNAAVIGAYLPVAGPVLHGAAEAARLAREAAQAAASLEVPARGAEGVGYKEILQTSQSILDLASQGFAASMVAAEIARASDPRVFAWVIPDAGREWQRFTRRADALPERRRTADLVVASLDGFTGGPRSADVHTPIPSPCLSLMRVRKRGATTLSEDLQRWEAADTLSFHVRSLRLLRCRESEAVPLGWGAAEAGDAQGRVVEAADALAVNPHASALASAAIASLSPPAGIARLRELDYDALADTRFPSHTLAVVARRGAAEVRTAERTGAAAGRMLARDAFAGGRTPGMYALSAAEVHFRRPADAPARIEYASLFNPYWHVRLVAPSDAQRIVAQGYLR